jgi:hypothetical protein
MNKKTKKQKSCSKLSEEFSKPSEDINSSKNEMPN